MYISMIYKFDTDKDAKGLNTILHNYILQNLNSAIIFKMMPANPQQHNTDTYNSHFQLF